VARGRQGEPDNQVEEQEEQIETADLIPEVTGDSTVDEAIFSDPDKWTDAIARGPQAIQAFIRKAGYVTAKEAADIAAKVAQRTVQVERQKLGSDAAIVGEFPDLRNNESPLFKATAAELKKLVALDPSARNRPATLYAAATAAKAKLDAAEKRQERNRENRDEDDFYERFEREDETERRQRAAAQDGSRTRTRESADDDTYLGPEARAVIAGMGITDAEFQASAREIRGARPRGRR